MKQMRDNNTITMIRMVAIITLVLFMSVWIAAGGRFIPILGIETSEDIENTNKIHIKVELITTEITTDVNAKTLREAAETGKSSPEDVRSLYATHPLDQQKVIVYFIKSSGESEEICNLTTDENGEANCIKILETSGTCGIIFANFSETEKYIRIESDKRKHCITGIPPFTDIAGPEWLVLFLFIGVLAAGLYASGRKPGSAFDVTTPKLKGPAGIKPRNKVGLKLFGSVGSSISAAWIRRRNTRQLSRNIEAAKEVIIKYGKPEMVIKLRRAKKVSTGNMVKLVSSMMIGGGIYGSLRSKLSVKEKERKRVLKRSRAKTGKEADKLRTTLIDIERTIEEYKEDLQAVSPTVLMPGENFEEILPKEYREAESSIRATFVGLVLGEKGFATGGLSENTKQRTKDYVDAMALGDEGEFLKDHPTMQESLEDIFLLKSEIERVRLVIYGKMIERIKDNKKDKTAEYRGIFKKKKPMDETGKDLLALVKKLNDKEYRNLLKMLNDIDAATLSMARTEKKFLDALKKIREINELIEKGLKKKMIGSSLEELKRRLENATEDAGMAYLILKKRSKGYRDIIEKDISRNKLPLKIRREDVSDLGEILVNDAFKGERENKKKVVNVLIDTYLGYRQLPGGAIIAERYLVQRGKDVIYVSEKEAQKIKTLDMLEDLRSNLLSNKEFETDVTTLKDTRFDKMDLVRKLDKVIKEIRSRKENK